MPLHAGDSTNKADKAENLLPIQFTLGYDDTGNQESGYSRILEGFTWGNAFQQGHDLTYQHIHGLDYSSYVSHMMSYRVPLPIEGHVLTASGSYSAERWDLHPGRDMDICWQYGLRYNVTLPAWGDYTHKIEGGADHKRRDYDADGGWKFVSDVIQFQVQYEGELKDAWGETAFCAIGAFSPGGLTNRNTSRNMDRERTGVHARYSYVYVTCERLWKLPAGVTLRNRIMGQVTDARVPYSEQLGFGGYETVRGFDESKIGVDQGLLISAELRSPDFKLGKFPNGKRFEHRLQGLAFFDAGYGDNKSRTQWEERSEKLESAGLGVRYTMAKHISVRCDYAWRITKLEDNDKPGRIHLGVTISF